MVGLTVDTATYTTTSAADMVEGVVTVAVNPDLVSKWLLSGAAAEGTQLVITTNSAADTASLTVTITTGDPAPNSPEMIDGIAIAISGANVGQSRIISASGATVATVTVPFPNDIAVGDVFLIMSQPNTPSDTANNANLTTALDGVRADIAVGTGVAARPVELAIDFSGQLAARRNSFVLLHADDHIFNMTT